MLARTKGVFLSDKWTGKIYIDKKRPLGIMEGPPQTLGAIYSAVMVRGVSGGP